MGQRHKGWRTITDERLHALESALKSQRNRREDRDNTSQTETPEHQAEFRLSKTKSPGRKTLKVVGVLSTVVVTSLGVVTGYLALVPKVTIVQGDLLNPQDAFTEKFVISNDGPLGINSVNVECFVVNMQYEDSVSINSSPVVRPAAVDRMDVGERLTVPPCPFQPIAGVKLKEADISIWVGFRPDFTWWHLHRGFRFFTTNDSNGVPHWFPAPLKSK
jgi:hypothetical protein